MHSSPLSRARLVAFAAALALTLSGCLIHSKSNTETSGRQISEQTFSKVRPGNTPDYVLALLGEPSKRAPAELGSEIWKWEFSEVKRSGGSVFLVLSANSTEESSGAVYVEFKDGVVLSTWRD